MCLAIPIVRSGSPFPLPPSAAAAGSHSKETPARDGLLCIFLFYDRGGM